MKVRVKFRKFGPVRYIGHLDVMRFFQKTIRRAEIDIAYTMGYSPHQIMSFASPLGLGLESNGEYMDIEVNSVTDSQDMIQRMNQASVPGIEVISIKELPEDAGNAMASVAAASYTVRFRQDRSPELDCQARLGSFYEQENIIVTKATKRGTQTVDLKPGIFELKSNMNEIHMLVDASSAGNIKPSLVIEAFMAANSQQLKENALLITREDTFTNRGTQDHPILISLDDVGKEIVRES